MKKYIFILLFILHSTISHAAWRENERRINTTLEVSNYNSIASKYLKTPTNVISLKMGGVESLGIEPKRGASIFFSIEHVDEYLAMIAKYIEWQKQATENGDAFSKEIGDVKSPMKGIRVRFGFYSGNATNHYLTILNCVTLFGSCSDDGESPQFYDLESAHVLIGLLSKMKTGEIKPEDVSEKYK